MSVFLITKIVIPCHLQHRNQVMICLVWRLILACYQLYLKELVRVLSTVCHHHRHYHNHLFTNFCCMDVLFWGGFGFSGFLFVCLFICCCCFFCFVFCFVFCFIIYFPTKFKVTLYACCLGFQMGLNISVITSMMLSYVLWVPWYNSHRVSFSDHITMLLSIRSTETGVKFVDTNHTFFECSTHER